MPHVEITMHVFSGIENPKWVIDGNHHKFSDIVAKVEDYGTDGVIASGLGYSGFTVRHDNEIYKIPQAQNRELERLLLYTSDIGMDVSSSSRKHIISNDIKDHVLQRLTEQDANQVEVLNLPAYEPKVWNVPTVKPDNNCYNYANNMITGTFAIPGKWFGKTLVQNEITGALVKEYATFDGLQTVTVGDNGPVPLDCRNLVALVVWPHRDFHWYRLDNDNTFSHKTGGKDISRFDNYGEEINDPRLCARDPYKDFVTFMRTDPQTVHID